MSETRETPARHQDDDPQASSGESAFVDTPVRQATRRAFDYPSLANLEALIAAVDARHAEEIAAKDRRERDLENALVRQEHLKDLAEAENTTLREQLAAVQQERDEKAAMHSELATLAGSAIVLATLDTLAGERPTQEPEHSLPAAVWRLVQERDEARAANTANLREMVGMAGRFRQTLQTVRACIVALTPGHRTGYDWNADPLYLTRKEGEALSAIDAALSSPSTQEPQTVCEGECNPYMSKCGAKFCDYQGAWAHDEVCPLTRSPESPNEGAK